MRTIDDLVSTIRRARETWTGPSWTHAYEGPEPDPELVRQQDLIWPGTGPILCDGDLPGCETCQKITRSARLAGERGEMAEGALQAARECLQEALYHFGRAHCLLTEARDEEDRWGDAYTWTPTLGELEDFLERLHGLLEEE